MHRSSKQRRQTLARRWKRALFAAAVAASFATGSFALGENAPARKKLPTKAVTPVAVTREAVQETSPSLVAPIVRPGELKAPAAAPQTLPRKTTVATPAAKLLGAKSSSFRSVAIEAISKEEPVGNSVEPALLKIAANPGGNTPEAKATMPDVKAKPIPSKPLIIENKPQVVENKTLVIQPAQKVLQPEKFAPIVSAASMARPPKQVAELKQAAKAIPSQENLPVAEENAESSPLSPWMQDIREPQRVLTPTDKEEALPTEYPATEAARVEPAIPESAFEPAAIEPAAATEPAVPMVTVSSPRSARMVSPTPQAKLTIFERAAVPAIAEVELVAAKTPDEQAEEPAEFVPPEEAAPIIAAPIICAPKRQPLMKESPEPKRAEFSSKPLRPNVIVNPKVSRREIADSRFQPKGESLIQAVQDAQPDPLPGPDKDADLKKHFEVIQQTGEFSVQVHRSKLLRTTKDIYRTAVVDDAVLEIVQFTPREISLIGRSQGSTHVTFWFDDPAAQPVTYLVTVEPDAGQVAIDEKKYQLLEDMINEMFPDSKIHLQLIANKLVVRGQARDSEEAFQIMTIIRAQGGFGGGAGVGGFGGPGGAGFAGINEGPAAEALQDSATGAARRSNYQLINMLRVPGIQQVALRVKIAELNRTAARNFGMNVQGRIDLSSAENGSKVLLNSILGTGGTTQPAVLANIDGDDISFGLSTLTQAGVIKLLSEPTLVTLSGNPATFIAGGEFAVPTIVGSAGLNAVTTDFRAFGAIISFLPTVVDKDRIRLQVAPEFSQINSGLTVNGTPGLKVRAATTTVEMREGQTLAIAGLLEDSINANTAGDIPYLSRWIGKRGVARAETELIILVTPELVHPMEPEEVPPLPGFDVTEPTNKQFYYHGDIEGNPTMDYRSTVWPRLKKRYKAGGPAMTSGPFGHGQ